MAKERMVVRRSAANEDKYEAHTYMGAYHKFAAINTRKGAAANENYFAGKSLLKSKRQWLRIAMTWVIGNWTEMVLASMALLLFFTK